MERYISVLSNSYVIKFTTYYYFTLLFIAFCLRKIIYVGLIRETLKYLEKCLCVIKQK